MSPFSSTKTETKESSHKSFSPFIANQILSEVWEDRKNTYAISVMLGNSFDGNCLSVWTRSKDRSLRMKLANGRIRFYLVCGNSVSFDGESSISEAGRIASVYVNRYGILDR